MKNKWHYARTAQDMANFIVEQIAANIVPQELISHINSVTKIVFSPDGSKFISGSFYEKDKTYSNLFMWDTKSCKRLLKLKVNPEKISTVSFSPNGEQILISCSSDKNNLAIWDVYTGAKICDFIEDNSSVLSAVFTPDSKKIISVDLSNRESHITIWDAQTGKRIFNIHHEDPHSCNISRVALSPDGMKIAAFFARGEQRDITIIDTNSGTTLFKINNQTHNITALEFSPDSTKIVSGNTDKNNNIHIWDAHTGEKLITIEGHHHSIGSEYSSLDIKSVQFSPNGQYIASTNYDRWNNFILWDAHTGKKLFDLIGHHNPINEVIFTPDNNYIISSSYGEEDGIIIWDIHSGKKLFNFTNHPQSVWSLALSPDGNTLVSGGYANKHNLAVWRIPFDLITIIKNDLDKKQIELLYHHYLSPENITNFTIASDNPHYATYQSLPVLVKKVLHQKNNDLIFYQLKHSASSIYFRLEIVINKVWEEQRLNFRRKRLLLQRKINNLLWKRKNKLEFLKLVLSVPPSIDYSCEDASNIEMCILYYFIACDNRYGTSSTKEVALDNQWRGGGGNLTSWNKEDGYILITDMYSEEELPTVLKISQEQFIKLLDDWEEKVYKLKPKEVTITFQNDEFIIETKN